ncbi:MAG: long-chain fatty acid--CoA ligase [Rhodospirillaceae bacterium]|nr:long-chain fatty acid--CoA ligase [Rhodospirillaceae bacterium]
MIVSGARSLNSAQFQRRVLCTAQGLAELGIEEGDSLALMLRNDFSFLEATFAAGLIGAYSVPINWHYKERETTYIIENSDAKALIIHADLLPNLRREILQNVKLFVVPPAPEIQLAYPGLDADFQPSKNILDWDSWRDTQTEWSGTPLPARGSMLYTSGTTGNPKGVRRFPASPELQSSMMERLTLGFALRKGIRALMTGPMYHSAPNAYARAVILLGGSLILMPRFDAEECLQLIERYEITHMHMVPTMFVRLLQLTNEQKQKYDLSSLESVVHGAAPCPPQVKIDMINWWGPIIYEYYGSTEASLITIVDSQEWLKRKGTVGKPLPETEVHILDENGDNLEAGKIGDIYVNMPVSPGFTYHKDSAKRASIEIRGLITNGDRGSLTEEGYLYLADRKADMVISGGVNIYPAEIEALLLTMPGLRDCAVFGIPDLEFGEKLVAAIEPIPDVKIKESEVRSFLANQLARFKVPKIVKFYDKLPREDSGKIFKRFLRQDFTPL